MLSENVIIGKPFSDKGGTVRLKKSMNCSVLRRFLTLSCDTIIEPNSPRFSFPPVWSECQ